MDLSNLKDTVSNLTLYDLKAGVRKVQNAVMNYTEMESKVREATNNEPWGASSSLMQEIANGTFNYQTLNEIMPMIYRRFTEKAAEEWRQIYKALQLLEYLIKHGSERVIDDARSHLTLLKMLRQFHFIDPNGKDQGINVRNRAKELTELLGDVDRIRAERKKARANKSKYTGVEGGTSFGGGLSSGSGSRYGGFGSDSGGYGGGSAGYGGFSGGVYGDGGGFGGETNDFRDSSSRRGGDQFEEYDEYDGEPEPTVKRTAERAGTKKTTPAPAEPPKKKEPEVDLFSFDDPLPSSSAAPAAAPSNGSGLASLSTTIPAASNDDDDFDDFQSATPAGQTTAPPSAFGNPLTTSNASGATFASPAPVSGPQQANLTGMMGLSSISPPPASTPGANYSAFSVPFASAAVPTSPTANKPLGSAYQPSGPNYFTSVQAPPKTSTPVSVGGMGALKPVSTGSSTPKAKASANDAFGALWASASGGVKKQNTGTTPGPALGQLAKEKSSAGIWGAPAAQSKPIGGSSHQATSSSSGLDDLLG
ncbi:Epsin-3, clathrin recruitment and traffic between the Golgi and endosome [Cytospora paraplurivora]|uniref:Epsin-3, clathrin recruitment and traffic between the Golgi and endosome n=1 Tax=Cytospora paraplurivora TaxID=2898453 RepID=A0AAN9U6A9_9PEZI